MRGRQSATCYLAIGYGNKQGRPTVHYLCNSCCKPNRIEGLHRERIALDSNTITLASFFTTTKNAARMPQINERNRLPWSALRCHRDRLSTIILAPFLAVVFFKYGPGLKRAPNVKAIGNPDDGRFPFLFRGRSGIHDRSSVLLVKIDSTNTY